MTELAEKKGWTGEELPEGARGVIMVKNYARSIDGMAQMMMKLRAETFKLINEGKSDSIVERLEGHPFFRVVMNNLAEIDGDTMFRMDAESLFEDVRDSIADATLTMCAAQWVADGADMPQEILDLARRAGEVLSDEEE